LRTSSLNPRWLNNNKSNVQQRKHEQFKVASQQATKAHAWLQSDANLTEVTVIRFGGLDNEEEEWQVQSP
jgi:hypothetical protein